MSSFGGAEVYVENGYIEASFSSPYYQTEGDYEEWYWRAETPNYYETLNEHLNTAYELLKIEVNNKKRFSLNVMIYGHIVAVIEGYLSSVFIKTTIEHEELIRKLVETDPQFANMKFTMSELFEKREQIKNTVAKYLQDLIFHDLKKIKPMYNDVLGHDFGDIEWLFKAVTKRHHCVHRAGYDKEGNPVLFADGEIVELIKKIRSLAGCVKATAERLDAELSNRF
ncbi:MAG: hypothetical protein ACXV7J_15855 [Methylomonas sp.]